MVMLVSCVVAVVTGWPPGGEPLGPMGL
jgi:hypothetical protein